MGGSRKITMAPKKEAAPPTASNPVKSDGGKQKKTIVSGLDLSSESEESGSDTDSKPTEPELVEKTPTPPKRPAPASEKDLKIQPPQDSTFSPSPRQPVADFLRNLTTVFKNNSVENKLLGSSSNGQEVSGNMNEESNPLKSSFASVLKGKSLEPVKITELRNDEQVNGASVVLPLDLAKEMNLNYENTLYGYFLGKRLAFPVVEHYVKNVWTKFGLERVLMKDGFFLFKFNSREGLNKVLESGPWLIRLSPLVLNVWSPDTSLKKEALTKIPVWVKLYNIPLVAFSVKGLSLIATQIGRPILMDSFTTDRCLNPWGKSSYARVLIEVQSEFGLPESVVIAIPALDGTGHRLETIKIEYEWKPPRCNVCKVFDHRDEDCPKVVKVVLDTETKTESTGEKVDDEGFVEVKKKKKKKKKGGNSTQIAGIKFTKPAVNFKYRPIAKGENLRDTTDVVLTNGFEKLYTDDQYDASTINCSDSEADEEIIVEDPDGKRRGHGRTDPHD